LAPARWNDQAATIILLVFALVFGVEQLSTRLRQRLMQQL
jgi:ABC-type phosphate/phosphonate transport system permease subunit